MLLKTSHRHWELNPLHSRLSGTLRTLLINDATRRLFKCLLKSSRIPTEILKRYWLISQTILQISKFTCKT